METLLDNPVQLRITEIEEKIDKQNREYLLIHFVTLSEQVNFNLSLLLYKPLPNNNSQQNKETINKLVRFCNAFAISTSHPSEIQDWIGKIGRANVQYSPDLKGENYYSINNLLSRNQDFTQSKLTSENNFRGDRIDPDSDLPNQRT